jgi:hypothetical protein
MRRRLQIHRDFQCDAVRSLYIEASRAGPGELVLHYILAGDTARLQIPSSQRPMRADDLWRRTCFEAFVGRGQEAAYLEFNVTPAFEWALYGFTGYRDGMHVAGEVATPRLDSVRDAWGYELRATLDLGAIGLASAATWRVAISAVIEDEAGAKSYWALAHPAGKPDFHRAEGFVLDLTAP